ncbi:DMT family transporter [Rhizobium leguminosarum]|uniref:DMT family transporter n=1 Tax=Rhizobium leguminosarum TaxID=384 RepID=UPI003F9B6B6B
MKHSHLDWLVLASLPILLSSNLIFGRSMAGDVAPFLTAFLRWLGTVLVLIPVLWQYRAGCLRFIRDNPGLWLGAGTLGMVVCGGVVYWSLERTTATNATLIYATSPLFVLVLELFVNGRRIAIRELAGIGFALVGIVIIALRGNLSTLNSIQLNIGDVGILLAAISWAAYTLILRSSRFGLPPSAALGVMGVSGVLVLLPFAGWEVAVGAPLPDKLTDWESLAGMVLVSSVLAYIAMQHAVRRVGATLTSLTMYLTPISSAVLAMAFLGETISSYHLVGVAFILVGLGVATARFSLKTYKSDSWSCSFAKRNPSEGEGRSGLPLGRQPGPKGDANNQTFK